MNRSFVDTSGWYAFLVAREKSHLSIRSLIETGAPLATSNAIFSELFTLLMARGYESTALTFGKELRDGEVCTMYRVAETDDEAAWQILTTHRGRGLSYADATTVALMRRLHLGTIVTLDQAFREFGLEVSP